MHEVEFYENFDNNHCYEAVIRMVLENFEENRKFTWKKIESITEKKEGLWTWPNASMLNLSKRGYSVNIIEKFDFKRFSEEGVSYIKDEYGNEVAKAQKKNSNIPYEMDVASELIDRIEIREEIPSFEDMKHFIEKDYLVICNVNAAPLYGEEGYLGHFVLVKNYKDEEINFHNPGLPPQEDVWMTDSEFDEAWAYPSVSSRNIIAIKK